MIKMYYRSKYRVNGYGVPQGSVLGPLFLLFILYIGDLPNVTNYDCTLFADYISEIVKTDKALTLIIMN